MPTVLSSLDVMPRKRRPSGRQEHPNGRMITVDDAWKKRVRDRLDELGWTQADLAAKIGATGGAITGIMKPGKTQSRLITRIHQALGFEPPAGNEAIALDRDSSTRLRHAVQLLSAADQQRVLDFAAALASSAAANSNKR